jgi:hypothetical protein
VSGWLRSRSRMNDEPAPAGGGTATFVRDAERRAASIIETADGRHRVLLATIEASERRPQTKWQRPETGKDDLVGVVQSSREAVAVGDPSPGLVEAFDDCLASLAWWKPGWIGAGAFGDQPRWRERRWRVLAGQITFYGVILALSGSVGWLIAVAVNA